MCLACLRRSREAGATGKQRARGKSPQAGPVGRSDKIRKVGVRQQWGRSGGFADHGRTVILTFSKIREPLERYLSKGVIAPNLYIYIYAHTHTHTHTFFCCCIPELVGQQRSV